MTDGCVTCHFEEDAIAHTPARRISGLPDYIAAGKRYRLVVTFDRPEATTAGMMIAAWLSGPDEADKTPAGIMESVDHTVESHGTRARSTGDARQWHLVWQAPDQSQAASVSFILWGNAANGDESPFGDRIHMQQDRRPFKTPVQ